jgi:alpha/beta superfamily hydrolase
MTREIMQERVRIPGPRQTLEGELAYPMDRAAASVLIVAPHPHMGGTMTNNLVAALADDLAQAGLITLRFNFGAAVDVAASMATFWATGHAPEDGDLLAEARAAAHWLVAQFPLPWLVVGYSFGAFAASQLLDLHPRGAVFVSPTLTKHDYEPATRAQPPLLVIYSDNDFATPQSVTEQWLGRCSATTSRLCIAGADHFFRDVEPQVCEACRRFAHGLLES